MTWRDAVAQIVRFLMVWPDTGDAKDKPPVDPKTMEYVKNAQELIASQDAGQLTPEAATAARAELMAQAPPARSGQDSKWARH